MHEGVIIKTRLGSLEIFPHGLCILLAMLICLFGIGTAPARTRQFRKVEDARIIRIAAASDLRFAMDEIIRQFHAEQPDIVIRATYGSSGLLYAQILNNAPFDIFCSADTDYPAKLAGQGFALGGGIFCYAVGSLALWIPDASPIDLGALGMRALQHPHVQHVAMANPKHAPYGRAAAEALKAAGLDKTIQGKLVYGENVSQALQFVQSGSAEIGILALSLLLAPGREAQGRFWRIPERQYPPLEQGGIILRWARDPSAARAFQGFLLGGESRAILKRFGYKTPGE